MYTIGQISNIMGISRDKLRYYEEKGILKPKQNKENNYRLYDYNDIDSVLAIEFYRSLDLDFKTIQKLHTKSTLNDIKSTLENKYDEIIIEIERLNHILKRIEKAKISCNDVEKFLNKFTIRPMSPIKVLGAISDFRAYDEFDIILENKNKLEENSIVNSLKRYITFSDNGIESNKMLLTKDIDFDNDDEIDVLKFDKCLFTIVEDGVHNKNVMQETFIRSMEWLHNNNYKHKGVALLSMLLMEYNLDNVKTYLEIFIPIE